VKRCSCCSSKGNGIFRWANIPDHEVDILDAAIVAAKYAASDQK
jgi:hypothetical protein